MIRGHRIAEAKSLADMKQFDLSGGYCRRVWPNSPCGFITGADKMTAIWNPREDIMVLKFFRANGPAVTLSAAKLATLALATAAMMAFGPPASDANAAPKKPRAERSSPTSYSYRSGPRTRRSRSSSAACWPRRRSNRRRRGARPGS